MGGIILFDIDGTLINNGEYPKNFDDLKKQIRIMKNNNYIIGICTFRPLTPIVKKIIKDYNLNGLIITEGGACIFRKKGFMYRMIYSGNNSKINLNKLIKKLLLSFNRINKDNISVKISNKFKSNDSIMINKYRKRTSTIRIPEKMNSKVDSIITFLKNNHNLSDMVITKSYDNKLKINISPNNMNKISVIEGFFQNKDVIFITDYEELLPVHRSSIKVYSVGINNDFNDCCDATFSTFGKGVEEILIKLRSEENERI